MRQEAVQANPQQKPGAVYTRKSSEEGWRWSSTPWKPSGRPEAYVASQRAEGWLLVLTATMAGFLAAR
jgi:hypothetical protein